MWYVWWKIYLTEDAMKPFGAGLPSDSPVFPGTAMTSTKSSPTIREKKGKKKLTTEITEEKSRSSQCQKKHKDLVIGDQEIIGLHFREL